MEELNYWCNQSPWDCQRTATVFFPSQWEGSVKDSWCIKRTWIEGKRKACVVRLRHFPNQGVCYITDEK